MQFQIFVLIIFSSLAVSMRDSPEKSVNDAIHRRFRPSYQKPKSALTEPRTSTLQLIASQIDSLRQRYLEHESDLWHIIDSGIDSAYVLEQIHVVHLKFLSEPFSDFNVTFDDYAVDRKTQLLQAIIDINRTSEMVLKNSLRPNQLSFDEKATIDAAQIQLDVVHQIDAIRSIAGSSEFYHTIKNKAELKQCDKNVLIIKSANQLVYEYYHDVSSAELKAYALVQLAYMFYTVYNRGNFRSSAQALRAKYLERTQHTQDIVRHLLEYSRRDIWKCDPNHYSIGTYEEITNFLQGYIDNEVNLNPDGTCQNTCTDYTVTNNYRCYDGTYCAQKPEGPQRDHALCKGTVVNCEFLGSDLNICSSTTSWMRWLVKCTNCFCLCDDQKHSERHFSLHDVLSDIGKNRVVSAVALRKFQGIFHLVINERELKPYATLNVTSPTWHLFNKLDYFNIHDSFIREGIDYHTLTWQNRSINLDTAELPTGKVVTGVRLRVDDGAITLQVRGTDFDFTSGRLKNLDSSAWYSPEKKEHTEIVLENLDVPILTPEKSIPSILPQRFLKFGPSDKFKDLSQTTIPFIDSQLVESHTPTPLSGVGFYYKAFPGYGGFVAPKILNYNLGPHIVGPIAQVPLSNR